MVNGNEWTYDAENRGVWINDPVAGSTEQIIYDGLGQRVRESWSTGGVRTFVHDIFGNLAAEYSPDAVAASPCQTCYLSADLLGSTRLVTDEKGNVVGRHDYLPYGEEIVLGRGSQWGPDMDPVRQKFTGQQRDSETGVDYFQARYYGSTLQRFTSADPANAGADASSPQSWNGYAYVGNNPVNGVDPTGMDPFTFYSDRHVRGCMCGQRRAFRGLLWIWIPCDSEIAECGRRWRRGLGEVQTSSKSGSADGEYTAGNEVAAGEECAEQTCVCCPVRASPQHWSGIWRRYGS